MVKFAVCDGDREMADDISDKLREYYPEKCEIKKYQDGESLLADSRKELFDVFFLDINLSGVNGIQIAAKIREDNWYVKIVFVTNREDLAYMGYVYGAFRYVRKRKLEEDLYETARSLNEYFDSLNENLNFKTPSGIITRNVKRIKYLEVKGHYLTVVCDENEDRVYGTMKGYFNSLKGRGFIRIHNSYLVNFRFISSIDKNSVRLSCGKELPLSRNRIDNVKKELLVFSRIFGD